MTKRAGAENARALAIRRLFVDEDFNLANAEAEFRAAYGRSPESHELADLRKQVEEYKATVDKLNKRIEQLKNGRADRKLDSATRLKKETIAKIDSAADQARLRLKQRQQVKPDAQVRKQR